MKNIKLAIVEHDVAIKKEIKIAYLFCIRLKQIKFTLIFKNIVITNIIKYFINLIIFFFKVLKVKVELINHDMMTPQKKEIPLDSDMLK